MSKTTSIERDLRIVKDYIRSRTDGPQNHPAHEQALISLLEFRAAAALIARDREHGAKCKCPPCEDVRALAPICEVMARSLANSLVWTPGVMEAEERLETLSKRPQHEHSARSIRSDRQGPVAFSGASRCGAPDAS